MGQSSFRVQGGSTTLAECLFECSCLSLPRIATASLFGPTNVHHRASALQHHRCRLLFARALWPDLKDLKPSSTVPLSSPLKATRTHLLERATLPSLTILFYSRVL